VIPSHPGPALAAPSDQTLAASVPWWLPLVRWLRLVGLALAAVAIVGTGAAAGLARYGGAYADSDFTTRVVLPAGDDLPSDPLGRAERLEQRLGRSVAANEVYVTVDTHRNVLRIWRGEELLREAICSTGSGVRLRDPRDGKEWIFDTPQGELRIWRKRRNPVWVKPDWAFIEEGYEPPRGMRDRVDDFSLGDYALDMPDGYIIHGTLFKTLLGKRVTHGCIRLGDDDLEFAYKKVPVGARVFLY
jgi:L,D-transpeptidase catalytic domain